MRKGTQFGSMGLGPNGVEWVGNQWCRMDVDPMGLNGLGVLMGLNGLGEIPNLTCAKTMLFSSC